MEKNLSTNIDFNAGYVIPVDKPYGWTSTDVVRKIKVMLKKRGYKNIKIGHAGTLDPLATGLVLICIGKATKMAETLQNHPKEYLAEVTLGATTPSFDLEHPVDATYPTEHITTDMITSALNSFIGEQEQIPPIYSAKSIDGRRAYQYARNGEEVEMRKAVVNFFSIDLLKVEMPRITVRIRCSKGTYIRSFARDIALELNTGGHLSALRRTISGDYSTLSSYTMQEVEDIFSFTEETSNE